MSTNILRMDLRHPFDIHIAESPVPAQRKVYPFFLGAWLPSPARREVIGFDAGKRYTLGELELLRMLGGFEDEERVFTDAIVDIMDARDHEIRKPRATAPYGPEWYMEQTFSLEDYKSGEVYAYGMLNRIQELADDEINEEQHTDIQPQAWLQGQEVA